MRRPRCPVSAALAALLLGATSSALGQGILFPRPGVREWPFSVKSVRVTADLTDAVAETSVEQTFVNNSDVPQEGTYLFPLPEGATVTSLSLRSSDHVFEGKVLSKDEARGIYESIVRQRKDPALLEYAGRGLFRASVFPIPAHDQRTLTLKFVQVLRPEGELRKFTYPLSTARYSSRPPETASLLVKLRTTSPLKVVYSPTHDVSVRRTGDHDATASWEGKQEFPDRDFALYYSTSGDEVGLSMLTWQAGDRDGYFMLIAAPRFDVPRDRIIPKQVVFVLDRTGSMADQHKLDQARSALHWCLERLNPADRFDLLTFNEAPDVLSSSLVSATPANLQRAHKFADRVDASGGTNIDEALRTALGLLRGEPGKQKMVVFLTDGQPTVGETNTETILANVQRLNEGDRVASRGGAGLAEAAGAHARVFCFGVGYDVNVPFLDRLAEVTHGDADYVRPQESIEGIVSTFFAKVSSPILSDVRLAFDGVDTYDVYPKELPDLFKGGQVLVAGRYRGSGKGAARLSGTANGHTVSFVLDRGFGADAASSGLVPRIWAMRKIGYLLDQVRLHSNKEVIDEIVRLSKEYGIITPYTSYLADDRQDHVIRPRPLTGPAGMPGGIESVLAYDVDSTIVVEADRQSAVELTGLARAGRGVVGKDETLRSLNSVGYRNGGQAPAMGQGGFGGGGGLPGGRGGAPGMYGGALGGQMQSRDGASYRFGDVGQLVAANQQAEGVPGYRQAQAVARSQAVGGRVFYRRSGVWFDNAYQSGQKVYRVKALSDAHFQLLHALPELNRYAAVGDEVVVSLGRSAVQLGAEGKERLTDAELREITAR